MLETPEHSNLDANDASATLYVSQSERKHISRIGWEFYQALSHMSLQQIFSLEVGTFKSCCARSPDCNPREDFFITTNGIHVPAGISDAEHCSKLFSTKWPGTVTSACCSRTPRHQVQMRGRNSGQNHWRIGSMIDNSHPGAFGAKLTVETVPAGLRSCSLHPWCPQYLHKLITRNFWWSFQIGATCDRQMQIAGSIPVPQPGAPLKRSSMRLFLRLRFRNSSLSKK